MSGQPSNSPSRKTSPKRRSLRPTQEASSLVTTLLVLVVLSTIVVAFMQSMSIERNVARSAKNKAVADLAADAGLEAFKYQLSRVASNNPAFLIGEYPDSANFGRVIVAGYSNLTNLGQMMPLISGNLTRLQGYPTNQNAQDISDYINARTTLSNQATININGSQGRIEVGAAPTKYLAPWVYLTTDTGVTNARYAYYVDDEWGRLNPRHHGMGLDRTNATNWYAGPGVVPLLIGTNALSTQEATNIRSIPRLNQSPHLWGHAFQNRSDYEAKKHLLSNDDTPAYEIIPNALTDGGKSKLPINSMATNSFYGATPQERAEKIAGIISTNLPNFASRDIGSKMEGLPDSVYLNRIAASIVDYIDGDSSPTLANGGEPAGKEATAFVVMVAERNTWVSETPAAPAPPPVSIRIRSEFFVQLWNPSTSAINGSVKLEVKNRQLVQLPSGGPETAFLDYESDTVTVSLLPNELKAVKFSSQDQDFIHFTDRPSSASSKYPRWPTTSSGASSLTGHPQFRLYWNGDLADMNRQEPEMDTPANSGLVRQSPGNTFGPIGIQRFSFNFCPPNTPNTVGDPRISYSCISDWATLNNITSALWQGRQTDTGGRQQNFLSTWADRDFIRDNIPLGSTLASLSADPTVIPSSYSNIQAALAPAQIRNGPMQSIGEIGHIFDPAQVNNTGGNPSGGTPASYYRPGGGRSLRVGQPEFTFATGSWNQSSLRAIELVDIFSVHSTNSNSMGYPVTYGKININTAPKEILEAIFHGITINSDPAANSASVTTTEASRIAQLIISNRPYNRISDLYRILPNIASGTNFSPVIPTQVGGGTTNLALMDRAREEFFGKFVELTSTQSRAFRVFVIGQALDPRTGRVLSQSFIESSVAWDSAPPNSKPNEAYLQRE